MTIEELTKANNFNKKINELEKNIAACKWITNKNVEYRESYLAYNGGNNIVIDKSLFKKIGLLILKHDKQKIEILKKQFDNL